MRYLSTRGQSPSVSFTDAILAGLAPDGGLYVPEAWPRDLDNDVFRQDAATAHFARTARQVLKAFAGDDLSDDECWAIAADAYVHKADDAEHFAWPDAVTPLVQIGPGEWVLELFHGPSLSFKDVAMQLIGPLYEHALSKRNRRLSVVCATSGDTGGAAVEALKGRERVDLFVLLPKGRVSDVQRLFMTASGAENVHALEIDGDFDDCQAIVKSLFADQSFAQRASLSGVNSINWARIVAQSVYFHIAANILSAGGEVSFSVPTGNFGDAFSGFVAKRTGAPIAQIMLATNANDILPRTFDTGRYQRGAASHATLSPAMDIQVASNFERIVFEAMGRDGAATERLYQQFKQSGGYDIPAPAMQFLHEHFISASVDDVLTKQMISGFGPDGYLACPHTAVGLFAPKLWERDMPRPLVTLATAHPAKFPDTVEAASGRRAPLPAKCADLFARKEMSQSVENDPAAVKRFIQERSRAWS